ncbi:MAG TPA: pyruvate dehydrogenase (acetyl-transferring), homodimeric type [Acidimicrobiaceae bacterium]|nr:pyruvate dehydrogenase (acetyl-transferring), homodimeric type [Acidimicrobiaceae bacterium]HCB37475.1 pyruvate dehydrogenase (acetyl-transferring), homodimeric type [Acidimicrobiaceae bacterium]
MLFDGLNDQIPDIDPDETEEWLQSFAAVVEERGKDRARFLIRRLMAGARELQVDFPATVSSPYINTISPDDEPWFPGDEHVERRLRAFIRWNAAAMVTHANKWADGIGGHLSTFASSAALYDVGFNHFWKGKDDGNPGDHVYIQGHAAPGIYARAYLEGRLDDDDLDHFRREIGRTGLSSYPHPRLMPDFWEYPTVSMGLGPITAIYHARFNRYLANRRIDDTSDSTVWCFVGDGETDEPETLGALTLASREKLDNLVFVVNCNLQRLDGPVRGNGQIIQQLEAAFRGAGWNVIKVVWGGAWDDLLARDRDGVLLRKMAETVDGQYQRLSVESGAYIREHFFGPDPRLRRLVEHLSDDDLEHLPRGGHDYKKIHAAYKAADEHRGGPTVILTKTIKGWTLGPDLEGRNATHQIKKLTRDQLMVIRDRLFLHEEIPEDFDADNPPYYRPEPGSAEHEYLLSRRRELGGPLPRRIRDWERRPLPLPSNVPFEEMAGGSGSQAVSTTMAFTRLLRALTREDGFGERVVPIIPDEARTFGMDALFRELGIYASSGQLYEPVDADLLLSYTEKVDGQILEEGITEAGSLATFTAAATCYAARGVAMVPFYTFYSMFGFQRVGDMIWALADMRGRGFLMGATAGRTTLMGEGLQHQDGHSPLLASTVPPCQCYDAAFAYELGIIVSDGIRRMYRDGEDIFYYLTIYNENYVQPPEPDGLDHKALLAGLYRFAAAPAGRAHRATLLFSGTAHGAAADAAELLADEHDVAAELWSATSYKALREDALSCDRWNALHPDEQPRVPFVTSQLGGAGAGADETAGGPVVAITDYMRSVPDQVSRWVPRDYTSLGTDGFGRSDTRARLREHFEVSAEHLAATVLWRLAVAGEIDASVVRDAVKRYGLATDTVDPWSSAWH